MAHWLMFVAALLGGGEDAIAEVLTQIGRDGTQTRLYSVCLADLQGTGTQSLAWGDFAH